MPCQLPTITHPILRDSVRDGGKTCQLHVCDKNNHREAGDSWQGSLSKRRWSYVNLKLLHTIHVYTSLNYTQWSVPWWLRKLIQIDRRVTGYWSILPIVLTTGRLSRVLFSFLPNVHVHMFSLLTSPVRGEVIVIIVCVCLSVCYRSSGRSRYLTSQTKVSIESARRK